MAKPEEMYQCQATATCGYIYNPDRGDKVPFWLLWEGDRLMGGIGAIPVCMVVFGREIAGEFACEMFIDRRQQRGG